MKCGQSDFGLNKYKEQKMPYKHSDNLFSLAF
jgi:hypothetical protein